MTSSASVSSDSHHGNGQINTSRLIRSYEYLVTVNFPRFVKEASGLGGVPQFSIVMAALAGTLGPFMDDK